MISEATLQKASRAATAKIAAFEAGKVKCQLVRSGVLHRKTTNELILVLSREKDA